jgi:hypothetical protein
MASIVYKLELIENFDDDAATEAALNVDGINGWQLAEITHQPNALGKSTATVLYKKSSSSSSVSSSSSSSSSSLSTSSTSLSTSSSSFSDYTLMGTGWPYQPDEIEVTIGSRWRFENVHFVEDEVIRLKRAPNTAAAAFYSEDGSDTFNSSTNRLRLRVGRLGPTGATAGVLIDAQAGTGGFAACCSFQYSNPYNFAEAFDNSYAFTSFVATTYFDTTVTSSVSPSMEWNGDVFKTFTFIDN